MDAGVLGQRITDGARLALSAGAAALYRLDVESGELMLQAVSGEAGWLFGTIGLASPGMSLADLALKDGRVVVSADLLDDPRIAFSPDARDRGAQLQHRAALCAPLLIGETALGVLAVGDAPTSALDAERALLFQAIADQAAMALGGARVWDEAHRQQRETVAIEELAKEIASSLDREEVFRRIVHRARELCRSDLALLAPYDEQAGVARIAAASGVGADGLAALSAADAWPGRGASGRVLETGEPFFTDDYATDPRVVRQPLELPADLHVAALAVVPIRFRRAITGLLWVADRSPRRFTADDLRVLGKLADQAAIALENSRLHAEAQELAVSRERMRMATELHDTLSQMLFSVALGLDWCLHRLSGSSELRTRLQDIKRETGVMMKQMRELIYHLAPVHGREAGYPDKLRRLVGQFREFTGIPVELVERGNVALLMPGHQEVLYKTFQEALANVAKHARATKAGICVDVRPDAVCFEVTDDGIGPPSAVDPARLGRAPNHFGLRQMLERIDALGGSVAFARAEPSGFRLWGMLPRDGR